MAQSCANWTLRAVFLTALLGKALFAADPWLQVSTPNFELYSNLQQDRSEALIARLEAARQTMSHLVFSAAKPERIRVIAFRTLRQYRTYCADEQSTAYFLHTWERDYIVIAGESKDIYTPAVHEYAHFVTHQQFHHLPRWMDEGLADVYSTVQEKHGAIRAGLPLDTRLEWLRMDGLAYKLPDLFQIQRRSGTQARSIAPGSRFYAESWILVHMLRFSPDYAPHFNELLRALDHGTGEHDAFAAIYQKTEAQVQSDLSRYLKAEWLPTSILEVTDSAPDPATSARPVSESAAAEVLDDLSSAAGLP